MRLAAQALTALVAGAVLGGCTTAPTQEVRSPRAQRDLAEALAGRTPGPPVRCIPNFKADQMQVIDDHTILFREGRTVYVQNPRGGCPGLGSGSRTLVTRQFGTSQLCDGDLNHTVDLVSGIQGGACVFGPFVPYTRPRS
ncbi:MAG TPA: DUF6491 family protein [Sphingomicrobium sp.]